LTADDTPSFRNSELKCAGTSEAFGVRQEEVTALDDEKIRLWTTPSEVFPEKFILATLMGKDD
jgi:hypothetical protein